MGEKIQYKRIFQMLKQEDLGFGTNQDPSGYVKIEVRENTGSMTLVVENLREAFGKFEYKVHLLMGKNENISIVSIGNINVQNNRGELFWEFNPLNVGMTGIPMNEFIAVAVVVDEKNQNNNSIICPLAGYKDKKIAWREKLADVINNNVSINTKEDIKEEFIVRKQNITREENSFLDALDSKSINEIEEINAIPDQVTEEAEGDITKKNEAELNEVFAIHENMKSCSEKDKVDCAYQGNLKGYNPCEHCNMHADRKNIPSAVTGMVSMEKLKENLTKCFEVYNPFGSKRRDYFWWKISNPVYLNNLLYQCNIRSPILFNPRVMMAHFKYRHIIFGIYTDNLRKREYLVCGVPGTYNKDENSPFGEMCKWVQLEGNKPKQGSFGYWLAYVDAKTGKLINTN